MMHSPCIRMRLRAHAGAGQRVAFRGRDATGTLLFCRQPPLRFIALLLLAGPFLFTLLKGGSR